jgi:hypothetical protein
LKFLNGFITYVRKGRESFQHHDFRVFISRVVLFLIAKVRIKILSNNLRLNKWAEIKNCKKGETLFLIGNGPSLNVTSLFLLKNQDTFCFNGFNLMLDRLSWAPTYYMVTDDLVAQDLQHEIPITIAAVDKAFFPYIHPSNVSFYKFIDESDKVYWLNATQPGFSRNLPSCGINNTVVNAAIQVGVHMGYSKIVFVGVDLSYAAMPVDKINKRNWVSKADDPNHFDARYFNAGKKFHDPQPLMMREKFIEARQKYASDVKFVNCGVGGNLDVFPREDLHSFLGVDHGKYVDLFIEEIGGVIAREFFDDFFNSDLEEISVGEEGKLIKISDANIVKKLLFKNVIKGPIYNIFYVTSVK